MKHYIFGFFALVLLLSAGSAEAGTVLRSGSAVSVANDQSVEDNFYAWGNSVTVSGDMAGDVVLAGGTVTVNGTVAHDVLTAGGTVTISGEIGDDVRIAAGDAIIDGNIVGNVTVFGGRVKILSTATIGGDVIIYGGDAILEGAIAGQVLGTVSTLRINGPVDGAVNVTVASLNLGERAVIGGNLVYVSQLELVRAADATIAGQITRNDPPVVGTQRDAYRVTAMVLLMVLFSTLSLYLVNRTRVMAFSRQVLEQPLWRSVLVGFAVLITTPFVVGLLIASVLGIFVGLVLFVFFILLLLLSVVMLPVTVGSLLAVISRNDITKMFLLWLIAGAGVLLILTPLMVVGPVMLLTFIFITLGTLTLNITKWLLRDNLA